MPEAPAKAAQFDDARRVELILRRVDTLPTLPAVATRLLDLTARDDADAQEVIRLVKADPALTSRILSMCRTAEKGISGQVLTIDKAVMLLGFTTVRNVVLSLQVGAYFEQAAPERADGEQLLDREALWIHSLAVAVMAEQIAELFPDRKDLRGDRAFVCGLLHDLGKLALDYVLPKSYGRVLRVAEEHQCGLAEIETRILGMDHHTAGKRLAESWGLPELMRDVIWLHGMPAEGHAERPSGSLITLVALANEAVRTLHLGNSGNHHRRNRLAEYAEELNIRTELIDKIAPRVIHRVEELGQTLGMGSKPSIELLLDAVRQANRALAKSSRQKPSPTGNPLAERAIKLIGTFQDSLSPQASLTETIAAIGGSITAWSSGRVRAAWFAGNEQRRGLWDGAWFQFNEQGEPVTSGRVEAPDDLDHDSIASMWAVPACEAVPWLVRAVGLEDQPSYRLLVIGRVHEPWAGFIVEADRWPAREPWEGLLSVWAHALAASAAMERSQQLSEEVIRVSTQLSDAQDELIRQRSLARLGEVTAGAAHEMNNPLTVISGRAQLLAMKSPPGTETQKSAQLMVREAQKLTDLISGLHLMARPPVPSRSASDLGQVIQQAAGHARERAGKSAEDVELTLIIPEGLPKAAIDTDLIRQALTEVIQNAFEAPASSSVRVTLEMAPGGRRAQVRVQDDGPGMDLHTLEHAFDPFFSRKPSGRRVGMGLSRARTFINGHDGRLVLDSAPGRGTTATVTVPLDRGI
ncbi:MAG: HDOD domain-containing protein [Phycisphaeraceae bacterium]